MLLKKSYLRFILQKVKKCQWKKSNHNNRLYHLTRVKTAKS
jgi:hypothetical protein